MGKRDEFDPRLKAYLHRGASTPPPAGIDARIIGGAPRRRAGWALQVVAAAAILVLAIGLGIVVQRARQSVGVTPSLSPSASPSASPSVKPTPYPTPTTTGAPYPLSPPVSWRMINASTGWAAGSGTDRILRTADGGSHWDDVTPPGARLGTWTTFFLDANNAWLGSSLQPGSNSPDFTVKLYRTSDGGQSWQSVGAVMADWGFPASMDFFDRTQGWLVMRQDGTTVTLGSDRIALYGTSDGGASWSKLSETDADGVPGQLPVRCSKGAPVFLNRSTGWMPGGCSVDALGPYLYGTRDGGRTWTAVALSLPAGVSQNCLCSIGSLRFSDARNAVFVLTAYPASPGLPESVLYATSDGGNSWRPGPALPAQTYEVYFVDKSHGWTVNGKANNRLLSTSDGGQHWSAVGPIPSTQGVMGFQFVTTELGWVLASEPRGEPLVKTSDGGRTWTTQLAP